MAASRPAHRLHQWLLRSPASGPCQAPDRGPRGLRPARRRAQQRSFGRAPQGRGTAGAGPAVARRGAGGARGGRSRRHLRTGHAARADAPRAPERAGQGRRLSARRGRRPRPGRGRWRRGDPGRTRARPQHERARRPPAPEALNAAARLERRIMRAILPPDVETRLVRDFFGDAPGFFVDVGANDPEIGSQTWHLEQAGWSGILVEPQPDLAQKLRQARNAKVFAVACSAPANAGKSMPLHLAGPLSTLNERLMDVTRRAEAVIAVPVLTLDQILREAAAAPPIGFLSIDVEGHAHEVLQGLDLAR